jgi:hypothetical protein
MVGRPPGGYVWQNGAWRRSRTGETGVLPTGIQVRLQVEPGVKQTFAEKGGQLVSTGVSLDPIMQDCVNAGVTEPFLPTCYESITKGGKISNYAVEWKNCAKTGIPPEFIPNCVQARQTGGPEATMENIAKAIQEGVASGQLVPSATEPPLEPAPAGMFSSRTLLIVGGIAGLLIYFLRRRQS